MTPPRPMLASTGTAPLESEALAYEPKYDGIRAIVVIDRPQVEIWSRLGNEKSAQFPEIVDALARWGAHLPHRHVLDGEIVALDAHDVPTSFQRLQGRMHIKGVRRATVATSVAFIAFDFLQDGTTDLRALPLRERRRHLERLFANATDTRLRTSEQVVGDGRALFARAEALGWEGLVAKRLDSTYQSGRRSPDWRKLKLVHQQTCVIGGWTDPRGSRPFFGSLLLGVYDESGALRHIGHSGAGFSDAELGRVWKQLHSLRTKTCPFVPVPRTNERPHWVRPQLVAEVKFTEWTADGKLRHPTYLGLREDVVPEQVRKEPSSPSAVSVEGPVSERVPSSRTTTRNVLGKAAIERVLRQLDAIQDQGGNGTLVLPGDARLDVTNLRKVFWPARSRKETAITKGDLFRHYVRVAPVILPILADRPLVMKRFPNGIAGKPFYQHRSAGRVPPGVRVATVDSDREPRPHVIGGDLISLLYTVQLASISQDPWFSRVGSEETVDHVAIDLDPPPGLPFARVLDVAQWVHEELEALGAPGFPKTSGASGLHIYIPMRPGTPFEAGLLFCRIVATIVARKHPRLATVERALAARGTRVYVDYLQNARGKTLASAYSARANDFAGVSTPLTWEEVDEGVSPRDFTIRTFPRRVADVGDLWAALRKAKGVDLRAAAERASKTQQVTGK